MGKRRHVRQYPAGITPKSSVMETIAWRNQPRSPMPARQTAEIRSWNVCRTPATAPRAGLRIPASSSFRQFHVIHKTCSYNAQQRICICDLTSVLPLPRSAENTAHLSAIPCQRPRDAAAPCLRSCAPCSAAAPPLAQTAVRSRPQCPRLACRVAAVGKCSLPAGRHSIVHR